MNKRWLAVTSMGVVAMLGFSACGGDDDSGDDKSSETSAAEQATTTAAAEAIEITGAWARSSPSMADAGAAYMVIANNGDADDALLGASVDPSIAGEAQIHEVVPASESTSGGMDMGDSSSTTMGDMSSTTTGGMGMGDSSSTTMGGDMGAMVMQEVDRIDIPAGESVELKPGGYHVMLLELAAPLEVGSTFTVTLTFENAGERDVTVEVREQA